MTEQFGFNQSLRDGAAGNRDKGALGARAHIVDGPRDQFLAGSALACHQHGGIQIGDAMHHW